MQSDTIRVLSVRHDDANMRRIAAIQEDIKKEEKNVERMIAEDVAGGDADLAGLNHMLELLADARSQV